MEKQFCITQTTSGKNQPKDWQVFEPGRMAYAEAMALQHHLIRKRKSAALKTDLLIILEHPPVFTLGRRGGHENLRVPTDFLEKKAVPIIQSERGGNITYHGPGQLVAYIIMDLEASRKSVKDFVYQLEESMIQTAACFGVKAVRNPANRGIWIGNRKMGSIGIAIRKGVTYHGLALNVNLSLEPFGWINPCGLDSVAVTSIQQETDLRSITMSSAQQVYKDRFKKVFHSHLQPVSLVDLLEDHSIIEKNRPPLPKKTIPVIGDR